MKNKKTLISFTLIIIILVSLSSIIGFISINMKNEYEFTTIYSEIVKIYGGGTYKYDTTIPVYIVIPHDNVNLFIVLPAFIISFILTLKKSYKGRLSFIGIFTYP